MVKDQVSEVVLVDMEVAGPTEEAMEVVKDLVSEVVLEDMVGVVPMEVAGQTEEETREVMEEPQSIMW